MLRLSVLLAAIGIVLVAGCAAPQHSPGSQYHCDRNGEREERAAC